jgi:hypothetical protein
MTKLKFELYIENEIMLLKFKRQAIRTQVEALLAQMDRELELHSNHILHLVEEYTAPDQERD